jgi:hypothetical protein
MAFSHGKTFRRLAARARSVDRAELRVLTERILPRRDGNGPTLRLKTDADRRAAPMVIVAAVLADAITGQEADDLLQQVENPQAPRDVGYGPREDDPLADAICAWGQPVNEYRLEVQGDRLVRVYGHDASRCGAADAAEPLVNNNENTSATNDGAAAGTDRKRADPLQSL